MQIGAGLEHAHSRGIVHRDIKPHNVMVLKNGSVKVMDFGIARVMSKSNTLTKEALGSVHYISPEQASGKPVDFYTDLYSVGVIFYEMLTGRLPFEGDTPLSIAMMHVNNIPVSPKKYNDQIPTALEQIIMKALSKNPEERFKTAASMNRVLKLYTRDNNIIFEKATLDSIDQTAIEPQEKKTEKKPKAEKPKYKHGRRTMFPIILGVSTAFLIVFMVAAVILAISVLDTTKDSSLTVVIPDLKGKTYDQSLVSALEDENIRIVEIEYVYDQNSENGTIVSQKPDAGQRKKIESNSHYSEMTIKISQGNESVTVPDINITEYRNALLSIEAQGLKYKIVQSYSNSVLDGYVISTDPQAGTTVPKGSTVTVYVSLGQEVSYTTMPDLSGKTLEQAKQILNQYEISLGKVFREPSENPTGTVLTQSIASGKSVPKKYTVVDITLSIKRPIPTVAPPTTLPIAPKPTTAPQATTTPSGTVPPTQSTVVPLPSTSANITIPTSPSSTTASPPASTQAEQPIVPNSSTNTSAPLSAALISENEQ
jgi:serine/threonine-protein kinase